MLQVVCSLGGRRTTRIVRRTCAAESNYLTGKIQIVVTFGLLCNLFVHELNSGQMFGLDEMLALR
jgi:hypothetical protein